MLFKEKLVILRKSKKLTQDEFASAVGVSRQAVYKWESGQSYPEVPKLLEMKSLLGISIDELLDDSFDIPIPEKKKRRRRKKTVEAQATEAEVAAPAPKAEEPAPEAPKEEPIVKEEPKAAPAPEAPKAKPAVKKAAPAPKAEPVAEEEEEVTIVDNDNGFEVADAPDIKMPGHVAMPKFHEVNLGTKKTADAAEKRSSFFAKFFGNKK